MAKGKLSTPEWVTEGFDSKVDWEKAHGVSETKAKGKTFKIRECPKCGSDDVGLVISGSDNEKGGGREWECHKCKWHGEEINEKELTEEEFMKYLDDKGEEVA